MKETIVSKNIGGKEITFKTGKIAKQANGSVLVSIGGTEVFGASTMGRESIDQDFFPLSVHYIEKFYARGKIPGGYFKREAKPTDHEVLTSRMIDRPIRPLFADGFRTEVQVMPTALSMDGVNPPDVLGMLAASASLTISDIPFKGPIGAVRVIMQGDEIIINPEYEQIKDSRMELLIAGTAKAITMIEGEADEVSEEEMLKAIMKAHEAIQEICAVIEDLRSQCGKEKVDVMLFKFDEDLVKKLKDAYDSRMVDALKIADKQEREKAIEAIYAEAEEKIAPETDEAIAGQIKDIIHDEIEKVIVRDFILDDDVRIDGRKMDEIRPIECEVDLLASVHGSALFTRGQTQALAITTLGSSRDSLKIDEVNEPNNKSFFLHYNFPPYSVGETGRVGATGRREIGHGMLAEKSLLSQLPAPDDFDFTIRVVSEIMESNGSSSMATICAGCMSLMAAGVPMKNPVAGIAMGLIMTGDKYKILTDIQGLEDHLGDMDFKVAGTKNGITGFQLDIKIEGITPEIMEKAMAQAKAARLSILEKMQATISVSREEMSPNAPQCKTVKIPTDKIKLVIGPGGKNIKAIVEQTGSDIDIDDSGEAKVFAKDGEALEATVKLLEQYTGVPEIGAVYDGTVRKIMNFGAFVEVMPGTDGLCHISEFSKKRINKVEDFVKEGDKLKVKVLNVDDNGRIQLSHKAVAEQD